MKRMSFNWLKKKRFFMTFLYFIQIVNTKYVCIIRYEEYRTAIQNITTTLFYICFLMTKIHAYRWGQFDDVFMIWFICVDNKCLFRYSCILYINLFISFQRLFYFYFGSLKYSKLWRLEKWSNQHFKLHFVDKYKYPLRIYRSLYFRVKLCDGVINHVMLLKFSSTNPFSGKRKVSLTYFFVSFRFKKNHFFVVIVEHETIK